MSAATQQKLKSLERRRQLAQAMMSQFQIPSGTQMSGTGQHPMAVQNSPLALLASLGGQYFGNKMNSKLDSEYDEVAKAMSAEKMKALQDLIARPAAAPATSSDEGPTRAPMPQGGMDPMKMQAAIDAGIDPTVITAAKPKTFTGQLGEGQKAFVEGQEVASGAPKMDYEPRRLARQEAADAESARHNKAVENAAAAKTAAAAAGALSDAAKEFMVDRLIAGEKPSVVLGNLGRGAQGAADLRDVQNRLADTAKSRGIAGSQLTKILQSTAADGRAVLELGAREGKVASRVQEAQNFAKIALDASKAVPRGGFVPWNKLSQMADTQMSDPKLAKLKAATVSLVNAYAAAVGGGTSTVHDKEAAENMLRTAQSPEAYEAVVNQLITETEQALAAPEQVRERMTGIHSQQGSDQTPITATGPNGQKLALIDGKWVPQ